MDRIVKGIFTDYEESVRTAEELKRKYPFLVCHSLGKSVCDRDIIGLSIGNYKNIVLLTGGFRGDEKFTEALLMMYIENLCLSFKNKSRISGVDVSSSLIAKGITVVPCVNPDGSEIYNLGSLGAKKYSSFVKNISKGNYSLWKANAKGVEIGKNFNVDREIDESDDSTFGPSANGYGGFCPESEPETKAIVRFCERNNIHHAFCFHEENEKIMWKNDTVMPENSMTMAKILSVCSGCEMSESTGEYGGFKNWFMKSYGRNAFSVGIGKDDITLEEKYKRFEEMLVVGTII